MFPCLPRSAFLSQFDIELAGVYDSQAGQVASGSWKMLKECYILDRHSFWYLVLNAQLSANMTHFTHFSERDTLQLKGCLDGAERE